MQKIKELGVIIFSMNRASQLHACLESLTKNLLNINEKNNIEVSVIWKATDENFKFGYQKLIDNFQGINFIQETETTFFKQLLVKEMHRLKTNFTMFLVDDIIFVAPISFSDKQFSLLKNNSSLLGISSRLHMGVTDCYATGQPSAVPAFVKGNVWEWAKQNGDWGYPMSVDGNIFETAFIQNLVMELNYSNPNTFEAALDSSKNSFAGQKPYLCCYVEGPRLINIPENRVQNIFQNKHAKGYTAEELNKEYLNDKLIDVEHYSGIKPNTVHVPMGLKLIEKKN